MNIQILQWLLKNRDVLMKVVDVAKTYKKELTYSQQWEIVDKIARLVLPVLEQQAVQPKLLAYDWTEQDDVALLAAGADINALGIDYQLLIDVIIPIIIAILQSLVSRKEE